MVAKRTIKSTCGLCIHGCGILIHFLDGKPVQIEGDPDSAVNQGTLCIKGLASLEYLSHPDRLKYPLKRLGKRGEGMWQHITWDEALDTVAGELSRARSDYEAEPVIFIRGSAKGIQDGFLARFANVFGSPNIASMAPFCDVPRRIASIITCGFLPSPDYQYPPACLITWGFNCMDTHSVDYEKTVRALNRGTKLVIIDPLTNGLTERADLWLRIRPGADLALALAIINVIINEGLYDKDFVDKWTVGFEQLKAGVQRYTPESVAAITWIDAETTREVARLYAANKPSCIVLGNGIEHNINSFQMSRAVAILRAITGNLGVPGGEIQWSPPKMLARGSPELDLRDMLPPEKRGKRLSAKDGLLPTVFYALPQTIIRAILDGDPYPIHGAYIQGGNLLLSYSHAKETYEAFNKLDFLAVSDMFMTPTASLADIVLPVASYLEYDSVCISSDFKAVRVQQKVAEVRESWSDYRILKELAKKLGLGDYFWDEEERALDFILKPSGLTFKEFKELAEIQGTSHYRNYESNGFETPSRKVELYSSQLQDWGFDPLPVYYELPETPYSNPELAAEYPLIFTSKKLEPYRHSGGRQICALRSSHPIPTISINPTTADKLGIKEGDQVYIATKRGKIKQTAVLNKSLDPRVVELDYGWWFPERGPSNLYDVFESNINVLTDNRLPYNREMGSANLRGILCRVYKVAD